ncbi:hypothetical protein CON07_23365 [Bacillus sp. AFS094611]|uniref:hypothetical protein n=1 Tax=Bacillus sp. AFS094611 TaxID=2033516 RepID=UPI000BED5368|nr:hypothetical protein [Bacillus sp. AFS094611]PDZ49173.1 hypothetical protein CON07_23365 [Bacillus sp. AFS094611]
MSIKDKLELINTPEDVFETGGDLLVKGHELVDTLSEFSPYLNVANKWMNKRRENKCKKFLQGLGMKVLSREELTSDDLKKLDELLKKNVNRLLVLDILEESTKTVSDESSKLLGIIAGQVMQQNQTFDYKDWILVNGLKNMNDWDIDNVKRLCLYFKAHPEQKNTNAACVYLNLSMKQYDDSNEVSIRNVVHDEDFKLFKSSLIKMSNLQILSTGTMLIDDDNVSFVRNRIADELYELINLLDNR